MGHTVCLQLRLRHRMRQRLSPESPLRSPESNPPEYEYLDHVHDGLDHHDGIDGLGRCK